MYMTIAQVAERLSMTPHGVYALVAGQGLPASRLGDGPRGRMRISEEDLKAWLETRKVAPPPLPGRDVSFPTHIPRTRGKERSRNR